MRGGGRIQEGTPQHKAGIASVILARAQASFLIGDVNNGAAQSNLEQLVRDRTGAPKKENRVNAMKCCVRRLQEAPDGYKLDRIAKWYR